MVDQRFFQKSNEVTLKQIIKHCKISLPKGANKNLLFSDISSLDKAKSNHISFLDNTLYIEKFKKSKAGACFLRKQFLNITPKNMIPLVTENPYHAFAITAHIFYSSKNISQGIHPKSHIEGNAQYDKSVQIDPGAVISSDVEIDTNCKIGANTVILSGVKIGKNTLIGSNCSIGYSILGSNIKIHNGVKIGQDGFGFAENIKGYLKMPQLGRVIIEDNVEIGANTTIDRGTNPDTIIGRGSKLDNLVQIGHNVVIGKNCIIVSQTGISGSTVFGNNVIVGGQVGIAGHLKIGNNVKIAAKSGVMKNIENNGIVGGVPAIPIKNWHRQTIILKNLLKK